ncbi:MAG: RNA polymerase subunit sigma-70, partial [Verrucomicrobiota bacterium]
KLPAKQRKLVESVYASGNRINHLAQRAGTSAMALYKQLHRIRMALIECTQRFLAKEDRV